MSATRRTLAVFALLPLLAGAPAFASDKKAEDKEKPAGPPHVDLAPVATPIIVGGQVKNYIFITVRLTGNAKTDLKALRDKEPMLRDAIVRVAHRTSFNRADSYNAIDEARARSALTPALSAIAGKGQLQAVEITEQQPKNLVRGPKS
jgi:flagellar basal body-associated protein FliL